MIVVAWPSAAIAITASQVSGALTPGTTSTSARGAVDSDAEVATWRSSMKSAIGRSVRAGGGVAFLQPALSPMTAARVNATDTVRRPNDIAVEPTRSSARSRAGWPRRGPSWGSWARTAVRPRQATGAAAPGDPRRQRLDLVGGRVGEQLDADLGQLAAAVDQGAPAIDRLERSHRVDPRRARARSRPRPRSAARRSRRRRGDRRPRPRRAAAARRASGAPASWTT
jgi:hypothetical protein